MPHPLEYLNRLLSWKSLVLLVLALAAGLAWRLELELRWGWMSLDWLFHFHWAVPLGIAGFIAWVVRFTEVRKPVWFTAALLVFGGVNYPVGKYLLTTIFGRFGGFGMDPVLFVLIVSLIWAGFPLGFCALCWVFGVRVSMLASLASAALFVASWPMAVAVDGLLEDHAAVLVHALKSGYIIPFLIVSLGLPILLLPRGAAPAPVSPY